MYNSVIDAVQTAQKTFVTTFVTNEEIAKPMVKLIDSQCETARLTAKAVVEVSTELANHATEQVHNVLKFDWTKYFDGLRPATATAKK